MTFEPITVMKIGTVFLKLDGEHRRLGIVVHNGAGDRVSETAIWILEDGTRGDWTPHSLPGPKAITLAHVDTGNHPLRALLNWAAKCES